MIDTTAMLGSAAVYALDGEVDAFARTKLLTRIETYKRRGVRRLVINLTGVRFLSSSGLSALIRARQVLREAGGELVLASPSSAVRATFEALGVESILPLYRDDATALSALGL